MTYKAIWANPPLFGTSTGQKAPPLITTDAVRAIQRKLKANPQIDVRNMTPEKRAKPDRAKAAGAEASEGAATGSVEAATSDVKDMCTYCDQPLANVRWVRLSEQYGVQQHIKNKKFRGTS